MARERLSLAEVMPVARPGVDENGLLFTHEDTLYRAFAGEMAQRIERLVADGGDDLTRAGLVAFEPADIAVEGYELVVRCERIAPVTYPTEWPIRMLQEAALVTLRVARRLLERGLFLADAHPWNVLFDGPRGVFVDLGSITGSATVERVWFDELRRHFLVPLWLHSRGAYAAADLAVREHRPTAIKRLFDRKPLRWSLPLEPNLLQQRFRRQPLRLVDALERWVDGLELPGRPTKWADYDQKTIAVDDVARYEPKRHAVARFLADEAPGTVLDIACSHGWYSRLAVHHGHRVTAIDADERVLCRLFERAARERLPILPLRVDIVWPPGSYGMGLIYDDVYGRLQSDVVLCLAILHHVLREHGVRFDWFAALLNRLARRSAIVEFIPRDDEHVRNWPLAAEPWYTLDGFVAALRPFFSEVEVVDSSPEPRKLVICRR